MKSIRVLLLLVVLILPAHLLMAGGCYFTSLPTSIPFGSISAFSGPLTTSQGLTAFCTPNSTASILISAGSNGSFSPSRTMSGSTTMQYNLYQDTYYGTIWGDSGPNAFPVVNGTPQNKSFGLSIYAAIAPQADPPAGSYSDVVTITMSPCPQNQTCSGTIPVTATIAAECISTSFTLDFGNYDPISQNAAAPATTSAPFKVFCTKNTKAWVELNNGVNGNRTMTGPGGAALRYDIFKDSGFSTRWTTGPSGGPNVYTGTSTSKNTPLGATVGTVFTAWGRIPPAEDVPFGGYSDTITATINY